MKRAIAADPPPRVETILGKNNKRLKERDQNGPKWTQEQRGERYSPGGTNPVANHQGRSGTCNDIMGPHSRSVTADPESEELEEEGEHIL